MPTFFFIWGDWAKNWAAVRITGTIKLLMVWVGRTATSQPLFQITSPISEYLLYFKDIPHLSRPPDPHLRVAAVVLLYDEGVKQNLLLDCQVK